MCALHHIYSLSEIAKQQVSCFTSSLTDFDLIFCSAVHICLNEDHFNIYVYI